MIISHSNKFILARPMKTAGLSFETAVSNYCSYGDIITAANRDEDWIRQQLKARRHRNDRTPVSNTRIRPHMPLKRLLRNSKLVPGQTPDKGFASEYTPDINAAMRTYQIVSMTRNPWEKIRSLYYHHLRFMKTDERSVSFKNWCNTVDPLVNSGDEDGAGIQTTLDYYLLRDFRVLNKFHSRVDFWIRFHYMKQDIINFERHYKMDGLWKTFDSYRFHVWNTHKRGVPLKTWYENRDATFAAEKIRTTYQWEIKKFGYKYLDTPGW